MDERFFTAIDYNPIGIKFANVKQKDASKIKAYLSK